MRSLHESLHRSLHGSALPSAAWAAVLPGAPVVGATATGAVVLAAAGRLDAAAAIALAAGLLVAGLLSLLVLPRESAEVERSLAALRGRLRLADEQAERCRTQAATALAGVSELVHGLVSAEEGARGQLAAELHDTVTQSLMLARSLLASSPTTPAELAAVTDLVEDAEEQVRAVLARTRPPALRGGDLAQAVSGLRADVRVRYGLEVHIDWPEVPVPLPLATAVTVYRFVQEALLNVVKHADVDDVELTLEVVPDGVLATVRDDGPGFEPEQVRSEGGRHVGLDLLADRARLSGGRLEIDSGNGRRGTVVRLWLPRPEGVPSTATPAQAQTAPAVRIPSQRRPGSARPAPVRRGG